MSAACENVAQTNLSIVMHPYVTVADNQDRSSNTWGDLHALLHFDSDWKTNMGINSIDILILKSILFVGYLWLPKRNQITHFPPKRNRNYGIFIFVVKLPFSLLQSFHEEEVFYY